MNRLIDKLCNCDIENSSRFVYLCVHTNASYNTRYNTFYYVTQCNNPMTKEAKLQAAMRILPEWVGYDEEIKRLQQEIENNDRQTEREEGEGEGEGEGGTSNIIHNSYHVFIRTIFGT